MGAMNKNLSGSAESNDPMQVNLYGAQVLDKVSMERNTFLHFSQGGRKQSSAQSLSSPPPSISSSSSKSQQNSTSSNMDERMDRLLRTSASLPPKDRRAEDDQLSDSDIDDIFDDDDAASEPEGGKGGGKGDEGAMRRCRRPCKGKRRRYRKLVAKIEESIIQDPRRFDLVEVEQGLPPSILDDGRCRSKLMARLGRLLDQQLDRLQNGEAGAGGAAASSSTRPPVGAGQAASSSSGARSTSGAAAAAGQFAKVKVSL